MLEETLTGHYKTSNIVSILRVQNSASLNIYTIFCHFISLIISGSQLDILVFSSCYHPPPRNHSTGLTNVYPWMHRVYIGAKPSVVVLKSYYFKAQSSFIKVERVGSPETSRSLFTKLHGIRPTIQLHWLQSRGFASQCFYVIKSYK